MASRYNLPVGGLIGKSISIYFGNLVSFVMLAAVTLSPWIVARFWFEQNPSQSGVFLLFVLQHLGTQVLTGALTFGVVQRLRGKPTDLGQVLSVGVKSFLRVLVVGIVYGLLVFLGLLLIAVPGLILMTVYYVSLPVAVLESKGVGAAMRRSSDLTRGNRGQIFAAVLLWALVWIGGIFLIGFAFAAIAGARGGEAQPAWLEVAINLVLVPLGATMPAVCYFLLRTGKENTDAQQVAAVFD